MEFLCKVLTEYFRLKPNTNYLIRPINLTAMMGCREKKICTLGTLWQNNNFNSFGIDLCICGKKNPSLNFRFFAFAFFQ